MFDFYDDPVSNNIDMSKYLSNIYCSRFKEVNKEFSTIEDLHKKAVLIIEEFIFLKLEQSARKFKNEEYITISKKEFNDLIFGRSDEYLCERINSVNNINFVKNILNSVANEFLNHNIKFSYSVDENIRKFVIYIDCSFDLILDEYTNKIKQYIEF